MSATERLRWIDGIETDCCKRIELAADECDDRGEAFLWAVFMCAVQTMRMALSLARKWRAPR